MPTRTIELNDTTRVHPAAGGRFIVRSGTAVEVIKAPSGSVRLSTGTRPTLTMGSPTRVSVLLSAATVGGLEQLQQVFEAVTGVKP